MKIRIFRLIMVSLLAATVFASCGKESESTAADKNKDARTVRSIAVFVPGQVAGSPTYEMMVNGVKKAVSEVKGASVKVIEGGFNQGGWKDKLNQIAGTGQYDLIVTSNPAMPEICAAVSRNYPGQNFFILDAYLEGHGSISTLFFNQLEQGFLSGYFGGLVTTSSMPHANTELKVGIIIGQEYPVMNKMIIPGFKKGLDEVAADISLDIRVIGNWYDAPKAVELAGSMYDAGVDVILTIAGGANTGVITAANEKKGYVLWFDSEGYSEAPGVVIGSTSLATVRAAYEEVKSALTQGFHGGKARIVGIKDGYVSFASDSPEFRQYVPAELIEQIEAMQQSFVQGERALQIPEL